MLEKHIEAYLVSEVKKRGGIAYKFTSPQRRSVPDRMVLAQRESFFVECKAPGKVATENQAREHDRMRELGHRVYVVDSKFLVDELMRVYDWPLNG